MATQSQVSQLLSDHDNIVAGIALGGRAWINANKALIRRSALSSGVMSEINRAIRVDLGQSDLAKIYAGSAGMAQYPETVGHFRGRCVAVTSLNPNPLRSARQLACVESWIRFGLDVITVNTDAELSAMSLPAGVTGVGCNAMTTLYDRPTQLITSLLRVGAAAGVPVLLLNSDLFIHGPVSVLDVALECSDRLTIGIRYNHDAGCSLSRATREPSGLDAFLLSPEMIGMIPDAPFGLGKPVWDYWLPAWARREGYRFNFIDQPLFYHESHQLGWSHTEWEIGAKCFEELDGVKLGYGSRAFRAGLDDQSLDG